MYLLVSASWDVFCVSLRVGECAEREGEMDDVFCMSANAGVSLASFWYHWFAQSLGSGGGVRNDMIFG